jgi:hypothetical protein
MPICKKNLGVACDRGLDGKVKMLKTDAIRLLGGTIASAAACLKVTPHAIHNWKVDKRGHLKSQIVEDKVLAAAVRERGRAMLKRGEHVDPFERRLLA